MAHWRRRGGHADDGDTEKVALARRFGATVTITTQVGHGFPDWVVGLRGHTVLVESKKETGTLKDLEPSQKQFALEWNGGPLVLIAKARDLESLLGTRDVLAWCRPRDIRVLLGYRDKAPY